MRGSVPCRRRYYEKSEKDCFLYRDSRDDVGSDIRFGVL